jgi:hypothetical protein
MNYYFSWEEPMSPTAQTFVSGLAVWLAICAVLAILSL